MQRPATGRIPPRAPLHALGIAGAVLVFLGGVSVRAAVAEPQPRLTVDYRAPRACPDVTWFAGRVTARTSRVSFVSGAEANEARVSVDIDESGQRGVLSIDESERGPVSRVVSGLECPEVLDGMALIVAMAMDSSVTPGTEERPPLGVEEPPPLVVEEPPPIPSEVPLPPPVLAEVTVPVVRPPAATARAASSVTRYESARPSPTPASIATVDPRRPPPLWQPSPPLVRRWALGLGAALTTGAGPELAPGGFGSIAVELASEQVWEAMVMLVLEFDAGGQAPTAGGSARFERSLGRVVGCPLHWFLARGVGVRPCVSMEIGAITGRGVDVRGEREARAWWFAPGVVARGEATPSQHLFLALDAVLSVPLIHESFAVLPDDPVYTFPDLAYGIALSGGVRLP